MTVDDLLQKLEVPVEKTLIGEHHPLKFIMIDANNNTN